MAGAVIWAGYVAIWWGWEAVTDRVPAGTANTLWWPSIRDLIQPGRMAVAVPPRLTPPLTDVGEKASGASSAGTNAAAANLLAGSTAPPPTVGTGAGDTGNITGAK